MSASALCQTGLWLPCSAHVTQRMKQPSHSHSALTPPQAPQTHSFSAALGEAVTATWELISFTEWTSSLIPSGTGRRSRQWMEEGICSNILTMNLVSDCRPGLVTKQTLQQQRVTGQEPTGFQRASCRSLMRLKPVVKMFPSARKMARIGRAPSWVFSFSWKRLTGYEHYVHLQQRTEKPVQGWLFS